MSNKSVNEIAAELLAAALAAKAIQIPMKNDPSVTWQAGEIATAFKKIREAVASEIPPGP